MQTTTSPFTKLIEMQFARDGKRTKLVGFIGQITDETGTMLHSKLYETKDEARVELDALVHGLLIDFAQRGLVDTLPQIQDELAALEDEQCDMDFAQPQAYPYTATNFNCECGAPAVFFVHGRAIAADVCQACYERDYLNNETLIVAWGADTLPADLYACSQSAPCDRPNHNHTGYGAPDAALVAAQKLAQGLANTQKIRTYVVQQGERFLIQDDEDLDVYFDGKTTAAIVATCQPIDPPGPNPEDESEGDSTPPDRPRAVTLTSIAIDARVLRCVNCDGPHATWRCPEIAAKLFAPAAPAPWKDIALGRELCRMRWRDFKAFVALLLSMPADHLIIYAQSYQAFIRDHSPDSDLTINDVLKVWTRIISDEGAQRVAA